MSLLPLATLDSTTHGRPTSPGFIVQNLPAKCDACRALRESSFESMSASPNRNACHGQNDASLVVLFQPILEKSSNFSIICQGIGVQNKTSSKAPPSCMCERSMCANIGCFGKNASAVFRCGAGIRGGQPMTSRMRSSDGQWDDLDGMMRLVITLQGINISHLRKIIFKMPFWGDMLVPWRVLLLFLLFSSSVTIFVIIIIVMIIIITIIVTTVDGRNPAPVDMVNIP